MLALWYGVLSFMLSTYVILDGRNFGAGMVHWVVARTSHERRQVIAAIGPLWLWHEVWLVGTGGVLLVAFPRLLASAFSGYYLAMFLILWCAILRGIAIEVGGHLGDHLWQSFWDAVFFLSSALLAILFGAALGNVIRGVPLQPDGTFHMAFFTDFRTRGNVGLLDWYTGAVALFAVLALTAHGATYLTHKTEGAVHDRAAALTRRLWAAAVPCFVAVSYLTWCVRPELCAGLLHKPLAWAGSTVCVGSSAWLAWGIFSHDERGAFLGSTFLLQGVIATGAAALYPVMLFSTLNPRDTLTVDRVASSHAGLATAIVWWPLAAGLALVYFVFILRYYGGKVSATRDTQGLY